MLRGTEVLIDGVKASERTDIPVYTEEDPATAVESAQTTILESDIRTLIQHETWFKQSIQEAVPLDRLFVPTNSTIIVETDQLLTKQIQNCLKSKYRTNSRIEQPGNGKETSIHTTFVNLALIEWAAPRVPDSTQQPTFANHIIVIGEAGVGKSVLAKKLACSWEKGSLWGGITGQFKAIFYFCLKDILSCTNRERPEQLLIDKCMQHVDLAIPTVDELKIWLKSHKDEILFICDGYDEVAELDGTHPSLSPLLQYVMAFPNVMVTSRPYRYHQIAGIPFQEAFSRHYRNIGFKEEDMSCYIEEYFKIEPNNESLKQSLLDWLKQYSIAQSIAHVPLQLGMLCSVWKDYQGKGLDNPTLTYLYEIIKRNRLDKCQYTPDQIERSEAVLAALAYFGMNKSQYRFTSGEIKQLLGMLTKKYKYKAEDIFKEALDLGFLKSTYGSTLLLKEGEVYYFVHLTYQEYYAACHVAQFFETITDIESQKEVDALINKYKFSQRYERVWWFVAGLLGIHYQETFKITEGRIAAASLDPEQLKAKNALVYFFDSLQLKARDILGGYDLALLTRCLEESTISIDTFSPEARRRLQTGLKVLRRAIQVIPGVTQKAVNKLPWRLQLDISPAVQTILGDNKEQWQSCVPVHQDQKSEDLDQITSKLEKINPASWQTLGPLYSRLAGARHKQRIQFLLKSLKDKEVIGRPKEAQILGEILSSSNETEKQAIIKRLQQLLCNKNPGIYLETTEALVKYYFKLSAIEQNDVIITLLNDLKNDEEIALIAARALQKFFEHLSSSERKIEFCQLVCFWLANDNLKSQLYLAQHISHNLNTYINDFVCYYLIFLLGKFPWLNRHKEIKEFNIDNLTQFLKLTLSICDEPEVSERLCLAIIYVCQAHQIAFRIEEEGASAYFKVYYQNANQRIDLSPKTPQKMESVLTSLRKAYCQEVPRYQYDQVFPEANNLMKHHSLWQFFHVPHQLAATDPVPSFISTNDEISLTSKQWRVGIGCKERRDFDWGNFTRNLGHAFLILEGIDQYGRGLYFRYDLCLVDPRDVSKGYHVISKPYTSLVDESARKEALYHDIQHGNITHYVSWWIDRETEVPKLIRALEADKNRDMTSDYVSLPTSIGAATLEGTKKVNCLTWARDHIKAAIGDKYKGELDSRLAIPTLQITAVKPPSESTCRLS